MGVAGDALDCELHNRILEMTAKITDKTTQEAVRLLLSLIRSVKSNLVRTLEEDYAPSVDAVSMGMGPPTRQRSEPPQIPLRARPTPPSARPPMWMRVNGGSTAAARAAQADGGNLAAAVPTSSSTPTPPSSKGPGGTPSVAEQHQFAGSDRASESPECPLVQRIQAPTEERTGLIVRRRLEVRAKTGGAITWASPRADPHFARSPFQSADSALPEAPAPDAGQDRFGGSPGVVVQLSESGASTVPARVRRNSLGTVPCEANSSSGSWEEGKASTLGALPAYTTPRPGRQHRPVAVWAKVHMRRRGTAQTTEDGLRQLLKLAQGKDHSQAALCGGAAGGGDLKGVPEPGPPAKGQHYKAAHHEGRASTLDVLPMWLQQR